MTFNAVLLLAGKTATGIEVPPNYTDLGGGKRPAVVVTLNGRYSYRSTVMPYAGQILLPVATEHREAAGLNPGDTVEVTLELDTQPRTVEVPTDLAAALGAAPGARARFDALSFTYQKNHVTQVESAKTDETRQKRIAKIVNELGDAP